MPYPNEHSCRLIEPVKFEKNSFRRIVKGKLNIIIGRLKGDKTMTTQAYRYPVDDWNKDDAAKHCKDAGGNFEAAKESNEIKDFANPINNEFIP